MQILWGILDIIFLLTIVALMYVIPWGINTIWHKKIVLIESDFFKVMAAFTVPIPITAGWLGLVVLYITFFSDACREEPMSISGLLGPFALFYIGFIIASIYYNYYR